MARPVCELVARLGFDYDRAPAMWDQALTHSSAEGRPHYERLEYLGDAVLKLIVSEWLYHRHAGMSEGQMSTVRARVVSDELLALAATDIELGDHLILGPAEKRTRGRTKVGTLASSFEALLGVVYLTYGHEAADRFLEATLAERLARAIAVGGSDNYKALLQEYTQKRYKSLPEYRLVAEHGPEHDRSYEIGVWVQGRPCGQGLGRSKKIAEQHAAQQALAALAAPASAETGTQAP